VNVVAGEGVVAVVAAGSRGWLRQFYNLLVRALPGSAAVLLIAIAPAFGGAAFTDRTSRVVPIAAGTPIRIDATVADVTITGSARSDLRIDVERRVPTRDDLAKLPVTIDSDPDGVHVAVVQAHDGRDSDLNAVIALAVPADALLRSVRVFEGSVRLSNVTGESNVDLRRGVIEANRLAGRIRLESGLGGIDVRDSDLTPGGVMRLRVFNGPLRVRFARPPANGRILAVTLNGTIASDIPLTMKDRFGPRFGESTLGTGDSVLSADVVKGDISLTVGKP
jgi:hypothetical protein